MRLGGRGPWANSQQQEQISKQLRFLWRPGLSKPRLSASHLHLPSCQSGPCPPAPACAHLGLPGIPSRTQLSSLPWMLVKAPYPVLGLLATGAPRTRPRLPSSGPVTPGITGPWSASELAEALPQLWACNPTAQSHTAFRISPATPP